MSAIPANLDPAEHYPLNPADPFRCACGVFGSECVSAEELHPGDVIIYPGVGTMRVLTVTLDPRDYPGGPQVQVVLTRMPEPPERTFHLDRQRPLTRYHRGDSSDPLRLLDFDPDESAP